MKHILHRIYRNSSAKQAFRFGIVGVLNTIVGYGSYLLFLLIGTHYLIAMICSHIIGVVHSYFWNKYWTFKTIGSCHKEKIKFVTVYMVTFTLNAVFLIVFVEKIGLSEEIAGLSALLIVTIISFLGHKFWSFKR